MSKSKKRTEFFAKHPYCCFGGGAARATEIDHIPARSWFRERNWWPEIEFPACANCNHATQADEQLLSMVVRLSDPAADIDKQEFLETLTGLKNNYPHVLATMNMRAIDKRRAINALGATIPPGTFVDDFPLLQLPPNSKELFERVAFKLGCSFYYKYLGHAVPRGGGFISIALTSYDFAAGAEVPGGVAASMSHIVKPKKGKIDLGDQFSYRFGVNSELAAGIFLCGFRESLMMKILVIGDRNRFPEIADKWIAVDDYLARPPILVRSSLLA